MSRKCWDKDFINYYNKVIISKFIQLKADVDRKFIKIINSIKYNIFMGENNSREICVSKIFFFI